MENLRKQLQNLNNKSYGAYKSIKGIYPLGLFTLSIDHVQGDPFATPSRISLQITNEVAGFDVGLWRTVSRKTGFEDYLTRQIKKNCQIFSGRGKKGSGKSGEIDISCNQQQVLQRNAVLQLGDKIEVRMTIGLPANGRRIAGFEAEAMIFDELPQILEKSLLSVNLDSKQLKQHVDSIEDQDYLRHWLTENNVVSFVANGAILPRKSGVDDRPLRLNPIKFESPKSLCIEVRLPNYGVVSGMAIPEGITLIVGGGFHGKSTLLNALELGVYNHTVGDGREQIATIDSAVKIRAEDGRNVSDVNISCFIDHLPFEKDTQHFFTENASGSTSQAANIVEAITAGAKCLLIDEDTSASNFMIRDARMQALVADDKEPITPLIYRVRDLFDKHGISSIIVMGGSGDYFSVADKVIMLDEYRVLDVTEKARKIASTNRLVPINTQPLSYIQATHRRPDIKILSGRRGKRDFKFDVRDSRLLRYGEQDIDLSSVEQLVDSGQTRSIAWFIKYYAQVNYSAHDDVVDAINELLTIAEKKGLDFLTEYKIGSLARPRKFEILAAINRIRSSKWFY